MKTSPLVPVLRAAAVLVALALVPAACGRTTGAGGGDSTGYPTGADQIVLQMSTGGGFVPQQVSLAKFPEWTLYGDGTLITAGPQIEIYPPPALPSVQEQHVTPEGTRAILAGAAEAGLTDGDAEYTSMMVTDMPTTMFTTTADGRTSKVLVYALSFEGPGGSGMPAVEREARAKISAFARKLGYLSSWLPKGSTSAPVAWDPTGLRVLVFPPVTAEDPSVEQPDKPWPLSDPMRSFGEPYGAVPDVRCGVVTGADLSKMLASARSANQLTNWVDGRDRANLVFRPELPGESGCGE